MPDDRIAIFTDEPGWHGRELGRHFAEHGLAVHMVSLTACAIDFAAGPSGIVIPGFDGGLPRGVFVRGVPGGSLEAITLRLDLLHRLAALGCVVMNAARAIERTVDKAMTSLILHQHHIPTPRTWVSEDTATARRIAEQACAAGLVLVKKPLFGSQGKGLRLIRTAADLAWLLPGEVAYLQEFVDCGDGPYRDCRIMVVGGRAIAAMERSSRHWVTNRAQGAECRARALATVPGELAVAAATAVGADYAGVDLIEGADGRWLVTEVNGIPAWQGLQEATGIDVGAALVAHFVARLTGTAAPA